MNDYIIEPNIYEQNEKIMNLISEIAEMQATNNAKVIDGYIFGLIKKRPAWMPEKIYRFLLKELFHLVHFHKSF